MSRWIAHLDMDAFYASVELLRYPELKGQPVVIGGRRELAPRDTPQGRRFARLRDYTGRGITTTATYAARAMSRRFKAAVAELAPTIEDRGIDEIYIDLSELARQRQGAGHDPLAGLKEVAQEIKNNVRAATGGLSCSIGLAPNKLLAKIASELDKPDGLTLIRPEDLAGRIWALPVRAPATPSPPISASCRSAARPPSSATSTRAATGPSWAASSPGCASNSPLTSRARATARAPSASSCASRASAR